jgi:drug/metabolite transporter (DMT)-like permease
MLQYDLRCEMEENYKVNHLKGIVFMLLALLSFSISDTFIKYTVKQTGNDLSLFNIIFVRGIFTSLLILISIFFFGKINIKKLFNE